MQQGQINTTIRIANEFTEQGEKNTKLSPDVQIPVLVTTPQHQRVDFQPVENESLLIQGPLIEEQSGKTATPKTADFPEKKISLPSEEPIDIKHSHHQRSGAQRIESTSVIVLDPVENIISTQKIETFQRERKQSVQPVKEKTRSDQYPAWRSSWSQRTLQSILENHSDSIERNLKPAYEKANNLTDKLYVIQYAVGHFWQQALCLTRWSAYPVGQHPLPHLNAWNQKFLTLLREYSHQKNKMYIVEQTQEFWVNLLLKKQPHHNPSVYAVGIAQLEFWKQYPTLNIKLNPLQQSTQEQGVTPSSSAEDMKLAYHTLSHSLGMAQQEETDAPSELKSTSFFRFDLSKEPNTTYSAALPLPKINAEITEDTDSLEEKIEAIIQQIEHIYLQMRRSSPGTAFRLMSTNPSQELHHCMQQLDQLYEDLNQDVPSQRLLVNAAYLGWVRLQTKFVAAYPENHLIQRELEIWRRRQLETRSAHTSTSSSACCCTIS